MTRIAPIFVSHGAPDLLLRATGAHAFLATLSRELERPRAILVASAHWATRAPALDVSDRPRTIHDFSGFGEELERAEYPAPGAPDVAREALALLRDAGFEAEERTRGLDHGAWVPLALAWPTADVPVAQIALQPHLGATHHVRMGRALEPLTREGVLVLGSGGATHNLRDLSRPDSAPPEWARAFDAWLDDVLERGDEAALVDYRERAPFAARNHPTEEHFFPLHVAFGAAGASAKGVRMHESFDYGSLSMSAYRFEARSSGSS